ncbi:helix-turn-helix domain-containing protein [Deinococcus oregonensis]|uniref:Helix-turn-helix domain-containing protein n=1 Tax=Deinococcus oregonensis TaxID=1805970 RepID=A0ABV6AX45_9DEIO
MREVSTFVVAESVLGSKDRASEVTKWESGKHFPGPENLVKIAEYFHCSTDYLLGVTDESILCTRATA